MEQTFRLIKISTQLSTIGQDELHKRITASKPTTCLLDPIPNKLLKELLPVAEEPILNIINSLSLGHVPKPWFYRSKTAKFSFV